MGFEYLTNVPLVKAREDYLKLLLALVMMLGLAACTAAPAEPTAPVEPTAAMDMETTLLSEKLIRQYVENSGCALILVTHSLQQARRIADEVWYFHKGSLLEAGATEQMLDSPEKAETRQFLEFYGM